MDFTVNLNKNSWHYRLQSWLWKDNRPEFTSLCPYFWFTVLTVVATVIFIAMFSVYFPIKALIDLTKWVVNTFLRYPTKLILVKRTTKWVRSQSLMSTLVQIHAFPDDYNKYRNTQPRFLGMKLNKLDVLEILMVIYSGDEFQDALYLTTAQHRMEHTLAVEQYEVPERKSWKPLWWRDAIEWTETIVSVLVAVGFVFLGLLTPLYIFWTVDLSTKVMVIFVIMGAAATFGVGVLYEAYIHPTVARYTKRIGVKTYTGSSLLINFVLSSFKKVCPGINWVDEPRR